jgi:hypothetical protein
MTESEWKRFLTGYNRELLSYEEIVETLSSEIIKAGWLGYAAATEDRIVATEEYLGTRLPASYRTCLKISNGWRFPSASVFDYSQSTSWLGFVKEIRIGLMPISARQSCRH